LLKDEALKKKGAKVGSSPIEVTVTANEDSVLLKLNFFCFCNDLEPVKETIEKGIERYNVN